jgi:hypothetical protein
MDGTNKSAAHILLEEYAYIVGIACSRQRQQARFAAVISTPEVTHAINGAAQDSSNGKMIPKWRPIVIDLIHAFSTSG